MSDEINRINPTVVEGAEDIHGAETFDADYSPLNRPAFSWRDNMAQSRRTLDKKQVGDMMKMRRMGKGMFDAQGYNDKLDESMGMSNRESSMKQSMKDRRDESKGMEKGMGRRAYQRVGTMDAEGIGSILGNVIPEPHFVGFEEIQREKMKNQNTKDAQGYNDKLDESMGMSNRESSMKQSMKDRRDESKGMEKGMGRRAYQRVGTMDAEGFGAEDDTFICKRSGKTEYMDNGFLVPGVGMVSDNHMTKEDWRAWNKHNAQHNPDSYSKEELKELGLGAEGEHGCGCGTEMDAEGTMLGSIGEGNDFGQNEAEEFGAERRYRYGNRYITRDSKGRFKKNVSVGRSLSADRRRKAKIVKGVGQGGKGDYGAESKFDELADEIAEQYEKKGKSKEEAEKIGKATAYKVGVAKYGKRGMTNKAKAGMRKKKMGAEDEEDEEDWEYHVYVSDSPNSIGSIEVEGFEIEEEAIKEAHEVSKDERGKGKTVYVVAEEREMGYEEIIYEINEDRDVMGAEETMLGSIGEGNDFGQMKAEEDYYTRDATFVCPESDCGCRGCYGCMGEDENPNCRCCGYVFKDGPTGMGEHTTYQCSCGVRACDGCIGEDDPTCPSCGIVFVHTTGPFDEQGNYIGSAEGDVVDLTQGVLAKGGVRVGGMTASAIVLAIAGLSGYYYARR